MSESLKPFASQPEASRGRLHAEPESPTRSIFQRDRDRIIHSTAFRRLQYKTQVFVYHEGDHYRTRLTHSLEVAQIARSVSRVLGLNIDLAEALALAHDLGHTAFGHAGEDVLKDVMAPYGGFDHNAQSLRVVTELEQRYARFNGLNLSWETLEGLVKHNGPLVRSGAPPLPEAIRIYDGQHPLDMHTYPGPEAQVASLADDIAYNNHDLDDGLRAGLFAIEDLADLPLVGNIFKEAVQRYRGLEIQRVISEAVRELFGLMVEDLIRETQKRLAQAKPSSAADIRNMGGPVVAFSDEMRAYDKALKDFLFVNMYRHYKVNRMTSKARRVVRDLFTLLLAEPECLPTDWRRKADGKMSPATARLVSDYIAGMTDRFALEEHRRLFDLQLTP